MKKLLARLAVAATVAAFAVPAIACEGMKNTQASTQEKAEKAEKKAEKKAAAEKKATVASAEQTKK